MAENPPVRSKFDRSQGKGLKAPRISRPGGVAPIANKSTPIHQNAYSPKQPKTTHYPPGNQFKQTKPSPKTKIMTD